MAHKMTIWNWQRRASTRLPTSSCGEGGEDKYNHDHHFGKNGDGTGSSHSESGNVEWRIATPISTRCSRGDGDDGGAILHPLPHDYGSLPPTNSRQGQGDIIPRALLRQVSELPPRRLALSLQQSVKWQHHMGTFLTVV
jgi:hypothetical protein